MHRVLTPMRDHPQRADECSSPALLSVLRLLPFLLIACATLPSRQPHQLSEADVAGEWVDLAHTTDRDTMVWVLAEGGDDRLLHRSLDGGAWKETRRHFGRWSVARSVDGAWPATLCFVRRPGRDASSCVEFRIDTVRSNARPQRRLTLSNYVGEHRTGERQLVERGPPLSTPAPSPITSAETVPAGEAVGGFQPGAVQPERPSVATHAGTVAPGFAELETGFERDRAGDGTITGGVPTLLKVGLTRRVQLSLQVPLVGGNGAQSGLGDVAVGVKWRIAEDDPLLQDIALLPQVKFSSGGDRGSGTTDASLLLINSRTIGAVGVDLNVGATRRSGDGSQAPRTSTFWAIAAGIPIRGGLGWALETYGYPGTGGSAGAAPLAAVLTGPTLVLRPELELDVGIIRPLFGTSTRAIYVGLVSNLGRLRKAR